MGQKSLDTYYEEYAKDIYRYLYSLSRNHHITEEIVQETFYRAYIHLEELTDERIKPWLFRVAHNAFVDYKRKEKREVVKENSFFEGYQKEGNIEKRVADKESIEEVLQEIDLLPDQQKQALLLTVLCEFTYKEIAEILSISESYVRLLIFRGRSTLRQSNWGREQ